MKRPLVATLIIGFVVAGIIGALHASGLLLRLELLAAELVPHHRTITRSVAGEWQYVSIVILSLGVAGLTLTSSRRKQVGWWLLPRPQKNSLVAQLNFFWKRAVILRRLMAKAWSPFSDFPMAMPSMRTKRCASRSVWFRPFAIRAGRITEIFSETATCISASAPAR